MTREDDDTMCYRSELEAAVKAEREACANIDWATILRHGGIVTRGDAETLADLVTAAIRARGQDPMPLFDDWGKGWK